MDIPPGSGGDNPPTYETLLRPTATVKPLPMEQDLIVPDVHIPFANEKSGTIKLKTSPSEEFARLQAEEDELVCGGEMETKDKCLQVYR